jgi:hypothetical protein
MTQQSVTQTRRCDQYGQCFNTVRRCVDGECTTTETIVASNSPQDQNRNVGQTMNESDVSNSVTTTTNTGEENDGQEEEITSTTKKSEPKNTCYEDSSFVILFEGKDRTLFFSIIMFVIWCLFIYGVYNVIKNK